MSTGYARSARYQRMNALSALAAAKHLLQVQESAPNSRHFVKSIHTSDSIQSGLGRRLLFTQATSKSRADNVANHGDEAISIVKSTVFQAQAVCM